MLIVAAAISLAALTAPDPSIASCYPTGLEAGVDLVDPPVSLGAAGAFDLQACRTRYREVLRQSATNNGPLPNVARSRAEFVGIDSVYYATENDVFNWHVSATPRELPRRVSDTCQPTGAWNAIATAARLDDPDFDPAQPDKYTVNQCANGAYISTLLYDGLFSGAKASAFTRTVPSRATVNGQSRTVLTWTRGYLLLKYGNPCADCASSRYRAVIDAGSSGTRLSLYKVRYRPNGYPGVRWLRTFERDAAENGIDDYVNPDRAQRPGTGDVNADVIAPLLDEAAAYFATHDLPAGSDLKVDVLATAGMREAAAKWGRKAVTRTYATIREAVDAPSAPFTKALRAHSAMSRFSAGLLRTINGNTQEGVWTWTNLNDYYCNYFKDPKGSVKAECEGKKYVGVVEVGGASMQVSFPVAAKTAKPAAYRHQVSLNGRDLRIYNKTFLGLGQDSARRSMASAG